MKKVSVALSITVFGCSVYDASLLSRTDSQRDTESDAGSSFASPSDGGSHTGGDTARSGASHSGAGRGGALQVAAGAASDESGGPGEDEAGSAGMAAELGGSSGGGAMSSAGTGGQAGSAPGGGGAGGGAAHELAQGKASTSSSQQAGNEPSKGNDTSLTTRWCADGNTLPQWWRVDLGASHVLTQVKVQFNHEDRQYTYVIETSSNDAVYVQRASLSGIGAVQTATLPDGVSARYVRLTVTATQDLAWASFWDLSVFGY